MPRFTIQVDVDADTSGFEEAQTAAKKMGETIRDELERTQDKARETSSVIGNALSFAGGGISLVGGGLFSGIVKAAEVAAGLVVKAFSTVGSLIKGGFSLAVNVAEGAFNLIVSAAKGAVSLIGKAFDTLGSVFEVVFNKITAIAAAATAFIVGKLGKQAASYEALKKANEALAKSIGTSSKEILAAIQKGTRGSVSELEKLRLANTAVTLGVVESAEDFEFLTDAAFRLGQAVGRNATEAFEDLSVGIGRQSRLILDNLGLIVKVGKANEDYAKKLNKTTAELTDQEKRLAFREATFEAIRQKLEALGPATEGLGVKFGRLGAKISDSFLDLAVVVGPALGILADAVRPLVERFREWANVNREIAASNVAEVAQKVADGIRAMVDALPTVIDLLERWASVLGEKVASAWDKVKEVALGAIRPIVGEVAFLVDQVRGLFAGDGFDATGSILVAGLDFIAAKAKEVGVKFSEAFFEAFANIVTNAGKMVALLEQQFGRIPRFLSRKAGEVLSFVRDQQDAAFDPGGLQAMTKRLQRVLEAAGRSPNPLESPRFSGEGLRPDVQSAENATAAALEALQQAIKDRSTQGQANLEAGVEKAKELGAAVVETGKEVLETVADAFNEQAEFNADSAETDRKLIEVAETQAELTRRIREEQRIAQQMLNKLLGQNIGSGGVTEG